jgi:hypothetical protein
MRAVTLLVPFAVLASCRDFGFIVLAVDDAGVDAGDAGVDVEPDVLSSCPEACGAGTFCETGKCSPCPALASNPADVYVDGAFEGGTGTKECPLASLPAAMATATASQAAGRTVHVAKGTYSTDARAFVVRGFAVVGAGAGLTIIEGTGDDVRDRVNGSRPSPGGEHYRSVFVVGHPTATTRISGMTLKVTASAPDAITIPVLCDQGNAPAMLATPEPPNTFVSEVEITGPFDMGVAIASWTKGFSSACNARITGSRFTGGRIGVSAYGCYGTTAGPDVAVEVGDGTDAGRNVFEKLSRGEGVHDYGVFVTDCVSSAVVRKNLFRDGDVGVYFSQSQRLNPGFVIGRYELTGNRFENLSRAGALMQRDAAHVLVDNVFEGIRAPKEATSAAVALELENPDRNVNQFPHPRPARRNVFVGNDVAVLIKGRWGLSFDTARPFLDFGSTSEAGDNIFRCNSALPDRQYTGGDVVIDATNDSLLPFRGNRWDHAPPTVLVSIPTGHDALVNGADVRRHVDTGPRVDVNEASLATTPCPSGAVSGP